MKQALLFVLFFFLLKTTFAQKTTLPKHDKAWLLAEKNRLDEYDKADHDRATRLKSSKQSPKLAASPVASRSGDDMDDDGMPDNWEALYGFDAANPKDAFGDSDLDGVMNLFEFQLGTAPGDPSSPSVVNVPLGQDLEALLTVADDQTLFRLQGGTYPLTYLSFASPHPRIVIQGGWNATFTERDICEHPTVLDGQFQTAIFELNAMAGENAVLFDGLTMRNGAGVFGSIKLRSIDSQAYWGIVDCEIIENAPTGSFGGALYLIHRDTCQAEVTILNTRITNNNTCGLYNQTVNGAQARWRLFNNSIAFNDDRDTLNTDIGLGIRAFTLSSGRLDATMTNTIFWGNDEYDLNFHGFGDSITIQANRCDIGITTFLSQVFFDAAPDCIGEDPQFVDAENGNLTLTASSPCLDTGLPLGFVFEGSGPDIGATPCLLSVSAVNETIPLDQPLLVYPNPTSDFIEVKTNEEVGTAARVSLYDANGRLLRSAEFENSLHWDFGDLPAGVYWVQIQGVDGNQMEKFVKQ